MLFRSTETTGTADSVDVVFLLLWQLEVDNEADLLNIDTTSKHVRRDQDTHGTRSELLHHDFSLLLVHLTVHAGDDEVLLRHAALEFVDSALRVAVDDRLVDIQVGVQVQQNVHLPLLLLDSDVVLTDTLEGQVLTLYENLLWVSHEVLGHTEDLWGESSGEKSDLDVAGQELENVLNLSLETTGQHLVSLIEHKELQVLGLKEASLHHVVDTAGGTDNDVDAALELAHVLADRKSTRLNSSHR